MGVPLRFVWPRNSLKEFGFGCTSISTDAIWIKLCTYTWKIVKFLEDRLQFLGHFSFDDSFSRRLIYTFYALRYNVPSLGLFNSKILEFVQKFKNIQKRLKLSKSVQKMSVRYYNRIVAAPATSCVTAFAPRWNLASCGGAMRGWRSWGRCSSSPSTPCERSTDQRSWSTTRARRCPGTPSRGGRRPWPARRSPGPPVSAWPAPARWVVAAAQLAAAVMTTMQAEAVVHKAEMAKAAATGAATALTAPRSTQRGRF